MRSIMHAPIRDCWQLLYCVCLSKRLFCNCTRKPTMHLLTAATKNKDKSYTARGMDGQNKLTTCTIPAHHVSQRNLLKSDQLWKNTAMAHCRIHVERGRFSTTNQRRHAPLIRSRHMALARIKRLTSGKRHYQLQSLPHSEKNLAFFV